MSFVEVTKTGAAYRVLAAISPVTWNKISFWGKASDVEFNDTKTAETKVGAIDGISSEKTSNSDAYAASTKLTQGLAGQTSFTISAGDWSGSTTTVDGTAYYTCTKQATKVYLENPVMFLIPSMSGYTFPTDAEEDSFAGLKMIANSTTNVLTFYSESNTAALTVGVKGVL